MARCTSSERRGHGTTGHRRDPRHAAWSGARGCRFIHYDTEEAGALIDACAWRADDVQGRTCGTHAGWRQGGQYPSRKGFDRHCPFQGVRRLRRFARRSIRHRRGQRHDIEDMEIIRTATKHVCGVRPGERRFGGPRSLHCVGRSTRPRGCVRFVLGIDLTRRRTRRRPGRWPRRLPPLQGISRRSGAVPTVADVDPPQSERAATAPRSSLLDDIYGVECDVFSPCALSAASTIRRSLLKVAASSRAPRTTNSRNRSTGTTSCSAGIPYAPDYAINAGAPSMWSGSVRL